MPAHIGERTQSPVLPADDDDRLLRHLVEEIVAGVGREALVSRAQPMAEEQPLDVGLENFGIVVEGLSQRMIGRLPRAESGDAVVGGLSGNVDVHGELLSSLLSLARRTQHESRAELAGAAVLTPA